MDRRTSYAAALAVAGTALLASLTPVADGHIYLLGDAVSRQVYYGPMYQDW